MPIQNKQEHPQYFDTIAQELLDYTRQAAGSSQARVLTDKLQSYDAAADKDGLMRQATLDAAGMSRDEKLQAARALAAERVVLSALGNMYRRIETPSPEKRFKDYFNDALQGAPDKQATREEQQAFVDTLKAAHDKMVISVVQTMHPTIYHTDFARAHETALTEKLEQLVERVERKPRDEREAYAAKRSGEPLTEEKAIITDLVNGLISGEKSITPDRQVSVVEENVLDRFNHNKMRNAFEQVVDAYNRALEDVSKTLQVEGKLDADLAKEMRDSKIKDTQAVWRTWAYGADADGRDLSTSIVLYDGIHHHVRDGDYIGRKRDLRENAKDQKECVSALIQKATLENPDFKAFCEAFLEDPRRTEYAAKRISWKGAKGSTALQLSEEEQAALYRDLLVGTFGAQTDQLKDMHLVPVSLRNQTVEFNKMFGEQYRAFLTERDGKEPKGALPDLNTLSPEDREKLAERISKVEVNYGTNGDAGTIKFKLDVSSDNGSPPSFLYSPQEGYDNSNFFEKAKKTVIKDGQAKLVDLTPKERRKTLDVVKRLAVLDDASNTFGDKVADRYQVANFENASDFYASLLLLKETGIINVQDGKVVGKPKLSLQPLLETEQDQKNSIALFSKLLDDPLVRSYYEALGNKAEMMVGYSDGAKSAGNLASEWSIQKCERDLRKVFADKGISLTFFHGRGRGDSRGGQYDEGQNYRASPPEVHQDMRFDETIQSDGPMNGAISKARGEDTLTSIVTGVLTAKRESDAELERRAQDPAYQAMVAKREQAMDRLAEISKNKYLSLVAENPATTELLNTVHDNDYKSSRAKNRGKKADFDTLRAISVEYGFNMADAPLHYIGMKTALDEFVKSGQSVPDEKGREVSGERALEVLYRTMPVFRNIMDKTERGMSDYDPTVFRQYAKAAGVSDWAKECIDELSGLSERVANLRQHNATKQAIKDRTAEPLYRVKSAQAVEQENPGPSRSVLGDISMQELARRNRRRQQYEERAYDALREQGVAVDKAAHALGISATLENGEIKQVTDPKHNPLQPDPQQDSINARIMRIISFVTSESHRNKGSLPPAAVTAAVDKVPFLARAQRNEAGASAAQSL